MQSTPNRGTKEVQSKKGVGSTLHTLWLNDPCAQTGKCVDNVCSACMRHAGSGRGRTREPIVTRFCVILREDSQGLTRGHPCHARQYQIMKILGKTGSPLCRNGRYTSAIYILCNIQVRLIILQHAVPQSELSEIVLSLKFTC